MQRRTFLHAALGAAGAIAVSGRMPLAAFPHGARRSPRDLVAVTGDGREVTLTDAMLRELAAELRGRVLLASDPGYDDARRILNPSFDRYPALIVQPTGPADVATAVRFATSHGGLLLAVKCGGHSLSGKSTCDRGMMIDLSAFRSVRVDPRGRRAWVTGGSLLGAVDHETMAHGLATPLGTVSHTGVGGLVTGGGFGRLARRFGLSIDNLAAVDVVTADGQLRHASAEENEDLFWGVRGGGGNFGVVTSFEFRLHPMERQVLAGRILFPLSRTRDVLELFGELAPSTPDDVQLDGGIVAPPGAEGMAGFSICCSGAPSSAERTLARLRRLGGAVVDEVGPIDYVALQRSGDVADPRAQGMYVKGGFITEVSPALITAIVDGFRGDPRRTTQMLFQHSGGAIARVAPDATAFSQRNALANMLVLVGWRHGDDPADHVTWIKDYYPTVERFTDGFYVNDLEIEAGAYAIQANYRQNHSRLVEVKNRYDPRNLFRLNANVEPSIQ
ncbi:MAG TPA: FAD-binding oxidoreductase [Longimicrobiaceae bacterium]